MFEYLHTHWTLIKFFGKAVHIHLYMSIIIQMYEDVFEQMYDYVDGTENEQICNTNKLCCGHKHRPRHTAKQYFGEPSTVKSKLP